VNEARAAAEAWRLWQSDSKIGTYAAVVIVAVVVVPVLSRLMRWDRPYR